MRVKVKVILLRAPSSLGKAPVNLLVFKLKLEIILLRAPSSEGMVLESKLACRALQLRSKY